MTDDELNAEVARRVMGWTLVEVDYESSVPSTHQPYKLSNGYFGTKSQAENHEALERCGVEEVGDYWYDGKGFMDCEQFNPTGSISAAWQVVEKMRELGWLFSLEILEDGDWRCIFARTEDDGSGFGTLADSAPRAIAVAALSALTPPAEKGGKER